LTISAGSFVSRGVLQRARPGWFVLLQPKALPAYAWKQVTTVRGGTHTLPMVKFNEPDDVNGQPPARAAAPLEPDDACVD
jgi:hypothetical protein